MRGKLWFSLCDPGSANSVKKLLVLAAVGEGATGLILLADPAIVVRLLLGVESTGFGVVVSRIYGVSLIALGIACWPVNTPHRDVLCDVYV